MRWWIPVIGFFLSISTFLQTHAQQPASAAPQVDRPWWLTFALGSGQLKLDSDEVQRDRVPALSVVFAGGHRVGSRVRAGVQLGGWTLQAFNLNDPTVGESVSAAMALADVFPLRTHPLFVRGGVGIGTYTNNRPTGRNGSGFAWEGGGGYEIHLSRSLRLVPMVQYCGGHLGQAGPLDSQTNSRYSVIDFNVGILYRFGG